MGWQRAVEAAAGGAFGRVLVVGPVDSGKSTFCRAVLARAVQEGRSAALIDADPGQKIVGPPATVTAARAEAPDALAALAFVGTANPLDGIARLVDGLRALAEGMPAGLLVANTSGLIGRGGLALKAAKLAVFRPDLIVALGSSPDLDRILAGHPGACFRLAVSPQARRKTAGARRAARQAAFRRYFEHAVAHRVPPEAVPADARCWPERLLVGLANEAGRDLALGILLEDDAGAEGARVLAPELDNEIARLAPGQLTLDEDHRSRPASIDRESG